MNEPEATLREIVETVTDLKLKAVAAKLGFVGYLLEMVAMEAAAELARRAEAGPHA
jgi:hypothetical protein